MQGTVSREKQELLFSRFGINYNTVDDMYKKGSIVIWEVEPPRQGTTEEPAEVSCSVPVLIFGKACRADSRDLRDHRTKQQRRRTCRAQTRRAQVLPSRPESNFANARNPQSQSGD